MHSRKGRGATADLEHGAAVVPDVAHKMRGRKLAAQDDRGPGRHHHAQADVPWVNEPAAGVNNAALGVWRLAWLRRSSAASRQRTASTVVERQRVVDAVALGDLVDCAPAKARPWIASSNACVRQGGTSTGSTRLTGSSCLAYVPMTRACLETTACIVRHANNHVSLREQTAQRGKREWRPDLGHAGCAAA